MSQENECLISRFVRIADLLHRRRHRNRRMHGPMGDPHRGQGRVLALLKMRPEISQKDLSFLLDIRQQSLCELLSKLERQGYIERTPSDSDRRSMDIRLTDAGAAAAEERCDYGGLFKCLEKEEQAALIEYLDRIIADLEKDLDDGQPDDAGFDPRVRCHGHGRGRGHGHGRGDGDMDDGGPQRQCSRGHHHGHDADRPPHGKCHRHGPEHAAFPGDDRDREYHAEYCRRRHGHDQ